MTPEFKKAVTAAWEEYLTRSNIRPEQTTETEQIAFQYGYIAGLSDAPLKDPDTITRDEELTA